ncbi:vacuolar sorting receptor [Xylona heveae TC161]|uniref:Vacuolar sorting receptor n=1 Tax=Xylona heveae (strain CBS 132557 / TC161) TaxID=1328760 RepID=A0A165HHJ0_XYLHT|nr:vacuolar sorting receptor [Xylona heveae TC161]KZF23529.1 vacuolar sorting receptor [Xylona heveae TC161]
MRLLQICALTLFAFDATVWGASEEKKAKPIKPCTVLSPTSGSFFDLTPISLYPPKAGKKLKKDDRTESWHAKGYDYPANFTLNVCAPVMEGLKDVIGVEKSLWRNVSAFYKMDGKTYSIGQQSSSPIFRGRKLVLNYTDGSPCPAPRLSHSLSTLDKDTKRKLKDDDDDDNISKDVRRKSTVISFLCDRDPLAPKAVVSFVGSPDDCAYFFEVRSQAACAGVNDAQQTLGPGGVFGVIVLIAVLVYLVGGCVYQRTVMHQRGWRQLPNYSMWAGIASFIKDMFVILFSSCLRFMPKRRRYSRVSNGNARGRAGRTDDENRLIDQLDEEWDE